MNIEQMLRDAIERKTAKILKEKMNKKNRKMKRYAIVYADGSNRRLTQIDYLSHEAAEDALMYYIDCNNSGYKKDGNNHLDPFDFIIKEIEYEVLRKATRRCIRNKK